MTICRVIVSAPVPVPFLWTLAFGFVTWIWDLDFQIVKQLSTNHCQSIVIQFSFNCQSIVNQLSTNCQPIVNQLSTKCQSIVIQMSINYQLSTNCQLLSLTNLLKQWPKFQIFEILYLISGCCAVSSIWSRILSTHSRATRDYRN